MAKAAFVTGGTGFVGLNLISQLVQHGWEVVALHRPTSELKYLSQFSVATVCGDINDPASLLRSMPRNVEAVFHAAGDTNTWSRQNAQQDLVNIDGTRNVVEAALRTNARRFIHTSSVSVYGLQEGRLDETTEQRGRTSWINYHRSKFFGEQEVRKGIAKGLDAVILNPSSIFGPYDTGGWARLVQLIQARELLAVPPGALSFCHSREVARAHVAAAEKGRTGENYLLGGTDATFVDVVKAVGDTLGVPVPKKATRATTLRLASHVATWASYVTNKQPRVTPEMVAGVTRTTYCDCSKAERELGFRPASLQSMVQDSVDWLRQEGFLDRWGSTGKGLR